MLYTPEEVFAFIKEEDVQFIRLSFCDIYGRQKNLSIQPTELPRAFSEGISFDASAIAGFGDAARSDLFLVPDPSTLTILPWRPSHGKVVRMFCEIRHPDGTPFEKDSRLILRRAIERAKSFGLTVEIGGEFEFYLFRTDENGEPTKIPFDRAGYMDVAPEDRGENIRREICLNLLDMGIQAERSHHEEGPGQNEIDFRYADALRAADDAMNFLAVVKAAAQHNGLYADFSPKPLSGESGNGLHINLSLSSRDGADHMQAFLAGILAHIKEITAFLNPTEESYRRLGEKKAPKYIAWSPENRSPLIRIPSAREGRSRMELRSPDPMANPYIAYALLIHAGLMGVERGLTPPPPISQNLFIAPPDVTRELDTLPSSLEEAKRLAAESDLVGTYLPGFLAM